MNRPKGMKPIAGLVAFACAAISQGQSVWGLPENVSNVRFQTLGSGMDAKTNAPGLYVFNEPVGWENYWRTHHNGAVPPIERGFFNNWRIIAIHAGRRPTTGYALTVQRIQRNINKADLSVVETIPPQGSRNAQVVTSPWIVLRVEAGAFDFVLRTRQVPGYPTGGQVVNGGTSMKIGGATVTFGPGYGSAGGCDHCRHRGRDGCRCGKGSNCDCQD